MSGLTCAVVIATAGRAAIASQVMADVEAQTLTPGTLMLSVPDETSLPADTAGWTVVQRKGGLAAQRNEALLALGPDVDVVFFFDDDAAVREDYLERAMRWFADDADLVGLTGTVLRDGAVSGEIPRDEAEALLAASEAQPVERRLAWSRTLYGCNMAVRRRPDRGILLDDRLPAYSWLEDHDLARRLMKVGRLGKASDCIVVHRAAKSGGRTNHLRLGYSQVMNPAYLRRKGSFPLWLTAWEIFRPSSKNIVGSIVGGDRQWRRERLKGNRLAWADITRGRFTPERILHL